MLLEIRCPAPATSVAELAVTCGETRLLVASAGATAARGSDAYRAWAVFVEHHGGSRRRLTETAIRDYDAAVERARIMAGERERARLWRQALVRKIGEEPDDD